MRLGPLLPSWACRSGSRCRSAGTTGGARCGSWTRGDLDGAWEALGRAPGIAAPRRTRARLRGGGLDHRRPRARRVVRGLPDRPEPPRRGDPGRIRRARPGRRRRRRARHRHRRDAGRRDGPVRHADRRALPAARRVAGRQRARAARPQLRPLDDRRRRDVAVRAAHPGDHRTRARVDGGAQPDGDGQPPRHGSATPGAARRAPRSPWPTRPSTSTSTTSTTSSNAARWAT